MAKLQLETTSRNARMFSEPNCFIFTSYFLIKNYQHSGDLQKQSTKCVINTLFKEAPRGLSVKFLPLIILFMTVLNNLRDSLTQKIFFHPPKEDRWWVSMEKHLES